MDASRGDRREDDRGPDRAISACLVLMTDFPVLVSLPCPLFLQVFLCFLSRTQDTLSITPEAACKRSGNCITFGHIHNHRKETPGKVLG